MEGSSLSLGLALTSVMLSAKGCCGCFVASSSSRLARLTFQRLLFDSGQIPPPPHSPSQLTPDGNLDLKLQTTSLAGWLVGCLSVCLSVCLSDCLFGLSTINGISPRSPHLLPTVMSPVSGCTDVCRCPSLPAHDSNCPSASASGLCSPGWTGLALERHRIVTANASSI